MNINRIELLVYTYGTFEIEVMIKYTINEVELDVNALISFADGLIVNNSKLYILYFKIKLNKMIMNKFCTLI